MGLGNRDSDDGQSELMKDVRGQKPKDIRTPMFKRELMALLEAYGAKLYEDDGMWCLLDDRYDRCHVVFYPTGTKLEHLPAPGKYVPAAHGVLF